MPLILCSPKSLPLDKLAAAARRAVEVNPHNEREMRSVARTPVGRRGGPRRIAVVVGRKWPSSGVDLSVSFLDSPAQALRSRILSHMNSWGDSANVVFRETKGTGQVRIARLDSPPKLAGFWSYIGTEILEIEKDEPTLNLEGFTMRTSDAEFRRVVRHEAGHTLGFDHEHMRSDIVSLIDREKAIKFYDKDQGWTPEEVEEQVLTPLAKKSIMGTAESDPLSIMCYHLPAAIMKNGKAVKGGIDINPRDRTFAASLYPKVSRTAKAQESEALVELAPSPSPSEDDADTFHIIVLDDFQPVAPPQGGVRPKPKFARVLATYGGARVTATMRLHADKGEAPTGFGRIIQMNERIRAYTNREQGSLPDDETMVEFGDTLFQTLFQGDIRRLYDEARSRQRRRLDFVLTSMIPWISEKPWEFAYDKARRSFLATEEIHFVRNVLTNVPADPVLRGGGPLRILVAAAQPVGFGRLSIDQEIRVIQRGFESLTSQGLATLKVLGRATPDDIHRELLLGKYQVLHFIGHGTYDETRRQGCLVFENSRGGEYVLGEREVREIFCRRGLSLVFLNACESGRGGRADFNKGVAQSLVSHGLPALVANQYSVLDSSATSFAQHFYWCLAQGLAVGQSAREARIAVNYSLAGESIDWAVPVLYARDPNMILCPPSGSRQTQPEAARATMFSGDSSSRQTHVAVWDVDDVFPGLDRTLTAMNAAQSVFGFQRVDISAPMDVWDLDRTEDTDFLRAERVADRLKSKAAEVGADVLACVTRHWLRDDDTLFLYGWWPDGGKPPVLIFSVAGFDQMEPEGPDTDRAIANAMVSCLAGFYGEAGTHPKGAKNCPLFSNDDRSYQALVGAQKFDPTCRKKLRPVLGPKLPALEALLAVFA